MMDQAERERLAQRIREEIDEQGSEANPGHIEMLLEMNNAELLTWIHGDIQAHQPTVQETIRRAEIYEATKSEGDVSTLYFGTRILISEFKINLFLLREIQARIGAIDVSPEKLKLS